MIKNIKKGFLALTAIGILSPILSLNIGDTTLYLTLINFGFKGLIPALLVVLLSAYPIYLNENLQDKLGVIFNVLNLILIISILFIIRGKISNLTEKWGIISGLITKNLSYSWGIILVLVGILGVLAITVFEVYSGKKSTSFKESKVEEATEIKETEEIK